MKSANHPVKKLLLLTILAIGPEGRSFGQCFDSLGTSPNVFTSYRNRTNNIAVNNDLNTVIFIHRNDVAQFGGITGMYRYDISTDNGATWQLDQGVLNPNSTDGVNAGRFPQASIHNPAGNTDPNNASLVYHGATIEGGFNWNGFVTGSLLLDGVAAPTESYNQAGVDNTLTAGGLCQSTPGTFWTIDAVSNNDFSGEGIRIMKGIYNAGDVSWTVNTDLTLDFNVDQGGPQLIDWNMAFDPSGMMGWVALLTHLNGAPDYAYHPVFYSTNDGGTTWSGPVQLEPATFPSITALEPVPACSKEIDITVDVNGHPHALVAICDPYTNLYNHNSGVSGNLFDLTFDGGTWSAAHVAAITMINTEFATGAATYNRPKMSRSDDGTKIVYTWVESDISYIPNFSSTPTLEPNLKAVTFDVPSGVRSCPTTYSIQCPSILNGKMVQTSVSPNLLESGSDYTVPVVVTVTNDNGDVNSPAQHYYLDDLVYTASDFSTAPSPAYPVLSVVGSVPFCQGNGAVSLTASASSSYLWNTGETTQSIQVVDGGNYWVVDPNSDFCISTSNSVDLYAVQPFFAYPFTTPILCDSGAASVDLGLFTYNALPAGSVFTWNTGDTTDILTVTAPGAYIAYIDGCPATDSVVVTAPGIPVSDQLCDALPLTIGTITDLNLGCATVEANEPVPPLDGSFDPLSQVGWFDDSFLGDPVANNTAWFSFVAPSSGTVTITTDGMDTQLALYSSSDNTCTGALSLIAANDDGGTFDPDMFVYLGSVIDTAYCYEAGAQYFIQVDLPLYYSLTSGTILVTANWNIPTITASNNVLQSDAVDGNQWYDQNGPIPGATSQDFTPTANGTYYTIVTVDGCSTTPSNSIDFIINSVASASGQQALNVYPNPMSDEVIVQLPGNSDRLSYQIVNAVGQAMITGQITDRVVVDTRPLVPGIYFLELFEGENTFRTKLVKR